MSRHPVRGARTHERVDLSERTITLPVPIRPRLAPPRIFVGDREARLLGTRTLLIEGTPVTAALVEIPGILCHCGGDEEGHPAVTSVALESCGTDATGREVFWDTGVVVDVSRGDGDGDGASHGWWLELVPS